MPPKCKVSIRDILITKNKSLKIKKSHLALVRYKKPTTSIQKVFFNIDSKPFKRVNVKDNKIFTKSSFYASLPKSYKPLKDRIDDINGRIGTFKIKIQRI